MYASGLALGLIENKISEHKGLNVNFIPYENDSEYNFKNFKVSFFRTNHSIPDSFGIAIKTELGISSIQVISLTLPQLVKADYYKMATVKGYYVYSPIAPMLELNTFRQKKDWSID